ncbi:unnamed protein product [Lampetra planeri]
MASTVRARWVNSIVELGGCGLGPRALHWNGPAHRDGCSLQPDRSAEVTQHSSPRQHLLHGYPLQIAIGQQGCENVIRMGAYTGA